MWVVPYPITSFFTKFIFMQNETLTYLLIIDAQDVAEFNRLYFEEHPKAKNAPIKAPQHPSINTYMTMHNQAANKLKQNWKDFIVWIINDLDMANKNIKKCRMTYRTFFKQNRRHDLDNISPKYILDGFVASGFIEDDDSEHIISLTTECAVDAENPRMEFAIEVIE